MTYEIQVLVRDPETEKVTTLKIFAKGMETVNLFLFALNEDHDIGGYTIKSVLN